jgi:predicted ATP-grasp superfamily ATP-dependent carboligase
VEITTSKRATALTLAQAGIAVAAVHASADELPSCAGGIVVKPDDGVGSQDTFFFEDRMKLDRWVRAHAGTNWIYQSFVPGEARSLSLLCCEGRARLLACNRQKVALQDGAFRFDGVTVNAIEDDDGRYEALAGDIARALPGLWGYCGVDFIEGGAGPIVIEINPRLTTSYAGLRRAIGVNPAQLVLELPDSLDAAGSGLRSRAIDIEVVHAG